MSAGARPPDLRVLGPLEVRVGGEVVPVGRRRVRIVLALLVARAGRVVSVARLAEELWGQHPPPDAGRTVRTYVSLLRTALRPAATGPPSDELIVTRPPGYLLQCDADAIDAARFERLVTQGSRQLAAGQPAEAAQRLAAALELWRGEPYGEFADVPGLRTEAARLGQVRLLALADRVEADLAGGAGRELIAELEVLTGRHPRHERLWGQLMTALYRAGQQTDALAAFQRARQALIEESGVEPSADLAEIHQRVLAQDPGLLPAHPVVNGGRPAAVPAQLPPAAPAFTGRGAELAGLDALLGGGAGEPAAVPLAVVSGTAGVGKTALAVHWAHRSAHRFPDGQLYLNLRGFDPSGPPMAPADGIRSLLDALAVPAAQVPPGLDAQAALYRSVLAGRRILVVLDNASDSEQVRPLLPGTPTAAVVVTSRDQLTGLVAIDGAHPVTLAVLSTVEAYELLARRLGRGRLAAEPAAVEAIIAACARLPLALTVAAARAATNPTFPLAGLAAELWPSGPAGAGSPGGPAADRLDALTVGDPASDIRTVFSWSYRGLSEPAARLFRLLGLHPGPDFGAAAAASLAGHQPADVRPLLGELTRASVLTQPAPTRYALHDLLRAYAADLAGSHDTGDAHRATGRLLDHYVHTALAADRLLNPHRGPLPLAPPAAGASPERLAGREPAMAWLTTEHAGLLAVLRRAADTGFDAHAWWLAWALDTFLERRGLWHSLAEAWRTALRAADRLEHPAVQAHSHRLLGWPQMMLGQHREARAHFRYALALHARAGELVAQAHCHLGLGIVAGRERDDRGALDHAQQALALYQGAGDHRGQAHALNSIGWQYAQLGDHSRALVHCERALALFRQVDDPPGAANTWDSLGFAYHHLRRYARAAECYRHAVGLYRDLGDRYNEADTLGHLGDTHLAAGDRGAALAAWHRALAILTDLGHPDAADLTAKVTGLAAR